FTVQGGAPVMGKAAKSAPGPFEMNAAQPLALDVFIALKDKEGRTQISGFFEGSLTAGTEKTVFDALISPDKTGLERVCINFSGLEDTDEGERRFILSGYADTTLLFSAQVGGARQASFSLSGAETARLRITCSLLPAERP
ncbi:MAG: hypothetical protein Q4G07_04250, partial [Oscillospiraceae bacterium]|nr:hypothetical protein [Oscillospiraceae bacterium]